MLEARSPKYTALYDPESGVRFQHGRAEVTEEQALKLAERRFTDGILVEGVPAKHWARDRSRQDDEGDGSESEDNTSDEDSDTEHGKAT